jgi:hypothetical protein
MQAPYSVKCTIWEKQQPNRGFRQLVAMSNLKIFSVAIDRANRKPLSCILAASALMAALVQP